MSIELVTQAAAFAAEAHGRQTRKASSDPYITHPLRVAHAAAKAGLSAEAVAASLLHDVVEDTAVTQDELADCFPPRVAHLVALLTQSWADDAPFEVKAAGKPAYYAALMADDEAMAIKLLDRADNLQDMCRSLPRIRAWAQRYLARTEREIAPLHGACSYPRARADYEAALVALKHALARTAPKG